MQSFLGIAPAVAPRGPSSASDISPSDARSASDPKNSDAFRTALDNANQRSSDSGRSERSSRRPTTDNASDASAPDSDAVPDESESATDTIPADAMAMLLNWLVPAAPTPTTPLSTSLTGSAEAAATATPIGMAGEGALVASFGMLSALPNGSATEQVDPALASTTSTTADGIDITGMTAVQDGQTVSTPLTTMTPAADALDADLLAATQATAEARAASAAAQNATAAGAATSAQATATATPADLASLAADFGAQIVATTGSTSRASSADQGTAAQPSTTGSTVQAAGAGTTAGAQLPGQAVAAAGAASQGTAGTLAEAMADGPEAVAAPQVNADARTDFQTALNAFSTNGVSQAQDVDSVQAAATTAPPIASQIADGALMAARRAGQSVEMVLQPEGLGSVSLRVSVERAGLAVHMSVDNPQAREMVQASWPQLQQALEQRGLTVQSLLLDLSNGRSNSEGFQAFQQFNGQQQFTGQQARGGSGNGDRRDNLSVNTVDESTQPSASVGSASRVDYRI